MLRYRLPLVVWRVFRCGFNKDHHHNAGNFELLWRHIRNDRQSTRVGTKRKYFYKSKIAELVTWSTFGCFNQNRKANLIETKNSSATPGKEKKNETKHNSNWKNINHIVSIGGQTVIVYTAKFVWFTKDDLILIIDFQTQDNFRPKLPHQQFTLIRFKALIKL